MWRQLVIPAVLLASIFQATLNAGENAGIVLYHIDHGGEAQLLLADNTDDKRGWSAFGGRPQADESAAETAARETEEETRGYFKRDWLLEKITDQSPVKSRDFVMYFVAVDHVPVAEILKLKVDPENKAMNERQHFAWIPYRALIPALQSVKPDKAALNIAPNLIPKTTMSKTFWTVWIANLWDAKQAAAIPWLIPADSK